MKQIPQFLISAPSSGSGKTTISVALMRILSSRGYKVQPFKCGPDYIDTKFHSKACNNTPSYNLDSFFTSTNHIKNLYVSHAENADICITEGMMGLFDGYNKAMGSAGEIAAVLELPVVLVVDAKSSAYSLTPILKGLKEYDKAIHIIGVIFNKVGSTKHRKLLEEVCEDAGLKAFGFIPKVAEAENKSRYLGLDFSDMEINKAADNIAEHIDIESLLKASTKPLPIAVNNYKSAAAATGATDAATSDTPIGSTSNSVSSATTSKNKRKILVARNEESFSFIYQEHIDRWDNVSFFNPEDDAAIPQDIDLLYLPGGYPEKHLEALSRCRNTMESIRNYALHGGRILAECGGMIYLCQSVAADNGEYPMCGVLPYKITARQQERKLALGYRSFKYNGLQITGHEFHYTHFIGPAPDSIVQVYDAQQCKQNTPIIRSKNTIASYMHLYWGNKDIFEIFNTQEP